MAWDDRAEFGSHDGHRRRVATSTGWPFYRVVAFVPMVHNSGSHDAVENLGLTRPITGKGGATRQEQGPTSECPTMRPGPRDTASGPRPSMVKVDRC